MTELSRPDPGTSLRVKQRRPKNDKSERKPGKHTANGFPHLSSVTGACMCSSACCHGPNGCRCSQCSGFGHENCGRGGWDLEHPAARP